MNNKPQAQFFEDPIFKLLRTLNEEAIKKDASVYINLLADGSGGFILKMLKNPNAGLFTAYATFGELFVPFPFQVRFPSFLPQEVVDLINDLNSILERNS